MELTQTQDYAIQAEHGRRYSAPASSIACFAGIRFAEVDGPLQYVYAKDEDTAAEIEDDFALLIEDIAAGL